MANNRLRLLARMAAERSELLRSLLGLDRRSLTEEAFLDGWTVKHALAHIAARDRREHRQMRRLLAGEPPDDRALRGRGVDAFNAAVVDGWRDQPLIDVVTELEDARATWVAWLRDLPEEAFFASRPFNDWDWAFPNCLEIQWQHDAEHAAQIAAWRQTHDLEGQVGPKCVLLAALSAAREELVALSSLVAPEERTSRLVCGVWTLKDVLGHLADWEQVGVEGLRSMARARPLAMEHVADIDAWNQEHAKSRREQPWDTIWSDLHDTREALVEVLERMAQGDLSRSYRFPWGPEGTAYQWVAAFVDHDREHASGLRQALDLEGDGYE
ncbi:MAG: DinB family protein [Anaerolineae bacterium]|nr:DinB family protein [Anaerolineae bacterium]